MSKIAKLIAKALNNSNVSEAAQSLRMAAGYMAQENVNPSEFLQEKGAATSDNSYELREAKELAIKWHKAAVALDEQLKDLAVVAVNAQEQEKKNYNRSVTWYNRFLWTTTALVFGCMVAFGVGHSMGYDNGKINGKWEVTQTLQDEKQAAINENYKRGFDNGVQAAKNSLHEQVTETKTEPVAPKPAKKADRVWHPRGGVYSVTLNCGVVRPSLLVNINESYYRDESGVLPNGTKVNLPDDGAPFKGSKSTVTYPDGSQLKCVVSSVAE